MCQFQCQGLNFGLGRMERGITPRDLFCRAPLCVVKQLAQGLRRCIRQGGISDDAFKFNVQFHVADSICPLRAQPLEHVVTGRFVMSFQS